MNPEFDKKQGGYSSERGESGREGYKSHEGYSSSYRNNGDQRGYRPQRGGYSRRPVYENNPQQEGSGMHDVTFSKELYIEQDDFAVNPPPKYFRMKVDGIVRLKGAYVVKCVGYDQDENGNVTAVHAEYLEGTKSGEEGANIKVKGTIHWVNARDSIDVTLNMFDYLILDGDGDYMDRLNPNSLEVLHGKAERMLEKAEVGTRFQFLREGYFIKRNENNEYNSIVGLKDGFKVKK